MLNKEEVKALLMSIKALYPLFGRDVPGEVMANAWTHCLKDVSASDAQTALEVYSRTDKTGFAPSVGQLLNALQDASDDGSSDEMEAWAQVLDAIRDGFYGADRHFNAFPPLVKKAVGAPSTIRQWSNTPPEEMSVIQAQFLKAYRAVKGRNEFQVKLPHELRSQVYIDCNTHTVQQIEEKEPKYMTQAEALERFKRGETW